MFQCGGGHLCGRPSHSLACGDGHGVPEARLGVGTAARGARGLSASAGPAAFAAARLLATQDSPGRGLLGNYPGSQFIGHITKV